MKVLKLYVKTALKQNRQNMKDDTQLCEKISEKYLPFGLEPMIPQNLLEFCKDVKGIDKLMLKTPPSFNKKG